MRLNLQPYQKPTINCHFDVSGSPKRRNLIITLRQIVFLTGFGLFPICLHAQTFPTSNKNATKAVTVYKDGYTGTGTLSSAQATTTFSYSDEFGRPIQQVLKGVSPTGKDIVQPVVYDADGRRTKSYMPYTATGAGIYQANAISESYTSSDQYNFYQGGLTGVEADSRPFSQNFYEKGILDRSNGPGVDWEIDGRTTRSVFKLNTSTEMRLWRVDEDSPVSYDYWPAKSLRVYKSYDEQDQLTKTYVDQRGLTVAKKFGGNTTYYVYNEFGNLRFILAPASTMDISDVVGGDVLYVSEDLISSAYEDKHYVYGPDNSVKLSAGFSFSAASNSQFSVRPGAVPHGTIAYYVFQYEYDSRQRLIKEKVPGAGWVYYVYDSWDRLVMSQNSFQRENYGTNQWSFVKYDQFNRPIITGMLYSNQSHASMQAEAIVPAGRYEADDENDIGYTLTDSYPTSVNANNILTVTYYDNYDFKAYPNWDRENVGMDKMTSLPAGFSTTETDAFFGMTTGSKVRVLDSDLFLNTVIYYDERERPLQTITENHLGGRDIVTYKYNDIKQVQKMHFRHENGSESLEVLEEYVYDNGRRLVETYHKINNEPKVLTHKFTYNELGQVIEKQVHSTDDGANFLQSIDYRYNIRGWLQAINDADLSDGENDLFGMEISYQGNPITIDGQANIKYYNGHIGAITWQTNNLFHEPTQRAISFQYDSKYQLESMSYGEGGGSVFNTNGGLYEVSNLTYDPNGNIQSLQRTGKYEGEKTTVDDLSYSYHGNQIKSVEDQGNVLGFKNQVVGIETEYDYFEDGSLKYDLNKYVIDMQYNDLGLLSYVEIDQDGTTVSVTNTYDAAGILLAKEVKEGNDTKYKADYVSGIVYENEELSFLHTSEGRAMPNERNASEWDYEYYYTDHLGSVRLIYGFFDEVDTYVATLELNKAEDETAFDNLETRASGEYGTKDKHIPNHTLPDLKAPDPSYSAMLNPAGGFSVGPALVLEVKAGDVVSMEAYARYSEGVGDEAGLIGDLAAAVAQAFGLVAGGGDQMAFDALSAHVPGAAAAIPYDPYNGEPKAYLNYILFDEMYNKEQSGWSAMDDGAHNAWQYLSIEEPMPIDGFLYIYVANESAAGVPVWFDDIRVKHEKATKSLQVVGSKDYYPFGMEIAGTSYWNESRKSYKYGYQGIYAGQDSLTQWTEFALRTYDPALGRFLSPDPYSQFASPYLGMGNIPNMGVDPDGGTFWHVASTIGGALIGGYLGASVQSGSLNPNDWSSNAWQGFLVGAALGAYGGAGINVTPHAVAKQNFSHFGNRWAWKAPAINLPSFAGAGKALSRATSALIDTEMALTQTFAAMQGLPVAYNTVIGQINPARANWGNLQPLEDRGVIIRMDRFTDTANSTTSTFTIDQGQIDGFFLEPAGPSSTQAGSDQRISPGIYDVQAFESFDHPNSFQLMNVPGRNGILIHNGNFPQDTEGCLLPGSSCGVDNVGNSMDTYNTIRQYLGQNAHRRIRIIVNDIPNFTPQPVRLNLLR